MAHGRMAERVCCEFHCCNVQDIAGFFEFTKPRDAASIGRCDRRAQKLTSRSFFRMLSGWKQVSIIPNFFGLFRGRQPSTT